MERYQRLRSALRERPDIGNMTALARRTGLKPVSVRSYFSDGGPSSRNAPLEECEIIGAELGVSGRWLFDGSLPKERTRDESSPEPGLIQIPLLDTVSAGRLANPSSQIPVQDVPLLSYADLGPGEFFATTVVGTSMDRISPDGSIIIVNRREKTLISGRCYIFSLNGETTYKRWQGGDPAYLEPYSTDAVHKPIFIRQKRGFEIVGRVKRTVLDL